MIAKKWLTLRTCGLLCSIIGALSAPAGSLAEPSLANLLDEGHVQADPVAQQTHRLAAQLAEIERRPFAADPAVQRALAQARAELSRARAAYRSGAALPRLRRSLALVQAALAAADRLQARAFAAAGLSRLKLQTEAAEAAARAAQAAYETTLGASSAAIEPRP